MTAGPVFLVPVVWSTKQRARSVENRQSCGLGQTLTPEDAEEFIDIRHTHQYPYLHGRCSHEYSQDPACIVTASPDRTYAPLAKSVVI